MNIPRHLVFWAASLLISGAGQAQHVQDRFLEARVAWERMLDAGEGASVRKAVEAMLLKEAAAHKSTDYNDLRAVVGMYDVAARAAVLEGAWEDALAFLEKALEIAQKNVDQSDATLGKAIQDHQAHVATCRDNIQKLEAKLKDYSESVGLFKKDLEGRDQAKASLDQHKQSVLHSEQAITDIKEAQTQIKVVRDAYAQSLATWKAFLAQEREELNKSGSAQTYVAQRVEVLKSDEARPRSERLSYARRLARLDPANPQCVRLAQTLAANDHKPAPDAPTPGKSKSGKKKPQPAKTPSQN